jgi:hypothetical protein
MISAMRVSALADHADDSKTILEANRSASRT